MAGIKISALPSIVTPAATDVFPVVQAGVTYKETITQLGTLMLLLSGGTMTGNLTLFGDPTTNLMAATKQYVDTVATGLNVQGSCRVATTAALTVTYSNGASGVGATLTNAGAMAALSIDSVSLSVNDRVLVKDQASTFQNGIYTVTTVGSGAVNWVMTRATDFDQPSEIQPGDFVIITAGTVNASSSWVETATVTTVGTDAITFSQFSTGIPVSVPNGGTGRTTSTTAYGLLAAGTTATGAHQTLATGSAGQVLQSGGAAALPTYSTATFASTYGASQILYSNGANTVQGLSTGNDGVLVTSAGGVPSISTTLPSGLTIPGYALSGANADITSMSALTGSLMAPTGILDSNGFQVITFTGQASADSYVNLSNANSGVGTTASQPVFTAVGTPANISITFQPKGDAAVQVLGTANRGGTLNLYENTANGTNYVQLKAPESLTAVYSLSLPIADAVVANAPLVSNAAGGILSFLTLPTLTRVITQYFTASGTYTPTSGMKYCIIECVGGGGAGGGAAAAGAGAGTGGGGGGGGNYSRITSTAATIGASQTVTIGAAGTAGTAGNNPGNAGGDTSVGTICIGKGGSGGGGSAVAPGGTSGAGGVAGTGGLTIVGGNGDIGQYAGVVTVMPTGGRGGNSQFGQGGASLRSNSAVTGLTGTGYGAGGGGGVTYNNTGTVAGGVGTAGLVVITEFVSI